MKGLHVCLFLLLLVPSITGLIRQYLPKRTTMAHVTQRACNRIAQKLNTRPRKRLGYRTPEECYVQN